MARANVGTSETSPRGTRLNLGHRHPRPQQMGKDVGSGSPGGVRAAPHGAHGHQHTDPGLSSRLSKPAAGTTTPLCRQAGSVGSLVQWLTCPLAHLSSTGCMPSTVLGTVGIAMRWHCPSRRGVWGLEGLGAPAPLRHQQIRTKQDKRSGERGLLLRLGPGWLQGRRWGAAGEMPAGLPALPGHLAGYNRSPRRPRARSQGAAGARCWAASPSRRGGLIGSGLGNPDSGALEGSSPCPPRSPVPTPSLACSPAQVCCSRAPRCAPTQASDSTFPHPHLLAYCPPQGVSLVEVSRGPG